MNQLLEILTEIRPESSFSSSHDFLDDGLLDSFDIVMLVSSLDKIFGISIEGTEIVCPRHGARSTRWDLAPELRLANRR